MTPLVERIREQLTILWKQAETRSEWQKAFGPLPWWYKPICDIEIALGKALRR